VVRVEDITERKRTEEALHESEDRFRVMADSCPTMLWVTDAGGGNQFIDRTFREFCVHELCDTYLFKPIDAGELLRHLKSFQLVE
jgi:hypothetical protein